MAPPAIELYEAPGFGALDLALMNETSGELRYTVKIYTRFTDTSHYPARRSYRLRKKRNRR